MLKRTCGILNGIIMMILAAAAGILILPVLTGFSTMAVISGSMEPGIPVGSVIVIKESEPEKLKQGDVITYALAGQMEGKNVTHRITQIDTSNRLVTTKGDANNSEDIQQVPFERIIGKKVFHVPLLGYISMYIKTPLGIAVICGIIFIMILLNLIPEIFGDRSKKGNHEDLGVQTE